MARVQEPIEIAPAPARDQVEPDLEDGRDMPKRRERERLDVATLDARDGRWRDATARREIALPPAESDADAPDGRSKPQVIHAPSLMRLPYPARTWPNMHPQTVGVDSRPEDPELGRPVTLGQASKPAAEPAIGPATEPKSPWMAIWPGAGPTGRRAGSTTERMFCTMVVDNRLPPVHNRRSPRG